MKPQPIYRLLLLALLTSLALTTHTQAQTIRYVSATGTNQRLPERCDELECGQCQFQRRCQRQHTRRSGVGEGGPV